MSEHRSLFGGGGSAFGSQGPAEVNVDLNLTPLMDVMSNILFFLLASFGAAIVSFLAVSIPIQSDSESPPTPLNTVTVNLQILPDSYKLAASNDQLDPAKLALLKKTLPKIGGAYDNAGLTVAIKALKLEYPGSETLIVVPSETTTYEEIIATMDATREIKQADEKRLRLLSKVVVADIIRADKEE